VFNPDLDRAAIRAEFQRRGRVRIDNALLPQVAERLRACLLQEVPWGLAYLGRDGKGVTLRQEEMRAMDAGARHELNQWIQSSAKTRYQFAYETYMIVTAYKEGRDPQLPLHRLLEFLNSAPGIRFFSDVSGLDNLIKADAQATRYLPGHFLKTHDDSESTRAREIAYVIGLSRNWQNEWGGLLHFLGGDDRVEDVLAPEFNTISLFRVPQRHFVSQVAAFAGEQRISITGWARSK